MNAISGQIQLKLSLSPQLSDLLQAKADILGVPITQFVKHLIIKEVETVNYPTLAASDWTQDRVQKALKNQQNATSIDASDLHTFFKELS